MAKFKFEETIQSGEDIAARIGTASGSANYLTDKEIGKAFKFTGDSRYELCVAGDPIEAILVAVEVATLDDFTVGTLRKEGRKSVVLDGLQATPGTGAIAIGDYVVTGTCVAKGTGRALEDMRTLRNVLTNAY